MLGVALALGLALGGSLASCGPGKRSDVLYVYAAASTRAAMEELNALYQRDFGIQVVLHTGASGALAEQIEQGGRCDVFVSAGQREVDHLALVGLIAASEHKPLFSNQLVIAVHRSRTGALALQAPADLAGPAVQRIALAHPERSPAGRYAKNWLLGLGLWPALEPKILPVGDVHAALVQVESGAADAAIVYATEARASQQVAIAFALPLGEGPRIGYFAVALEERPRRRQAAEFVAFLSSPEAREAFRRHGFLLDEES